VSDANPVFERITTPGIGAHLSAGAAVRATGVERTPTAPAPLLGTHTDEVLHEVLGLDGAAVGRLHDAGVVAGPERDPTAG
jgi:2-methylfumaryl-CoA isomerase